jgi:hypothetical protein
MIKYVYYFQCYANVMSRFKFYKNNLIIIYFLYIICNFGLQKPFEIQIIFQYLKIFFLF